MNNTFNSMSKVIIIMCSPLEPIMQIYTKIFNCLFVISMSSVCRYFQCIPLYGLFAPVHKVAPAQRSAKGLSALGQPHRRESLGAFGSGEGLLGNHLREKTGSQESISSMGSAASSASRGGRLRLGVTSLSSQVNRQTECRIGMPCALDYLCIAVWSYTNYISHIKVITCI